MTSSPSVVPNFVAGVQWLILDDDPEDIELLQMALEQVSPPGSVIGMHPRAFLDQPPRLKSAKTLTILDGRLPSADWRDVVAWLHREQFPFVVVSGSRLPEDRLRALEAGARAYFGKPVDLGGYQALAQSLLAITGNG